MTSTLKGFKKQITLRCCYTVIYNQSMMLWSHKDTLCAWWNVLICIFWPLHSGIRGHGCQFLSACLCIQNKHSNKPYTSKDMNNTPLNKNASLVIILGYHLNIILVYDISYCAVGSRHTVIKLQVGHKPDLRSASRSTFVIRTTQRHVVIAWHVIISH